MKIVKYLNLNMWNAVYYMIKSWWLAVRILPNVEQLLIGKVQGSLTLGRTEEGAKEGLNKAGWTWRPVQWLKTRRQVSVLPVREQRVQISSDLRCCLSSWPGNDLSLWSFYLLPLDLFWVISEYFGTVFDNVCLNLRQFFYTIC